MSSPGQGAGRGKRRRLSRSAEFERVYRQGRSRANRFLVVYSFPRPDAEAREDASARRLGLSVGRRVGGAVERNRVKRMVREAFWACADKLAPGQDFVVIARPAARELAASEGEPGIERALHELLEAGDG